jgi:hypothetical protein
VPQAVAELDVIVLFAEPGDVAFRITQQPRSVQQVTGAGWHVLVVVLAPLAAQLDALVDAQPGVGDRGLGVLRAHRGRPAAHDGKQECCLGRTEQAGREHLVDQRAAARLQHAAELTVGAVQVLDQAQDITAPDQVG